MKSGRDKKIAEEIRREVSQILHFELKDPRVMGVSVTGVRMTPDLRMARVYFAMPGAPERLEAAREGLKHSAGYIRHLLAERIRLKFMPQVEFFYDESFELEEKIEKIFQNLSSGASREEEDIKP
jgi:ribosome-binding factor A